MAGEDSREDEPPPRVTSGVDIAGAVGIARVAELPAAMSRSAFDALVAENRAALYGRARSLCRKHLDADDLVQDTLERAFKGFGQIRDADRGRAWLFSILVRVFIDHLRRRRVQPESDPIDEERLPAPAAPPPRPRWADVTPDDLRAAIAKLPADVREVYRMHALEGNDYIFIADALAIPKGTVGTRLLRARRLLRELLAPAAVEDA
jgi:RNA polymerase sigma-70 factor, ECF subfamily